MLWVLTITAIFVFGALIRIVIAIRRMVRVSYTNAAAAVTIARCQCGYELGQLDTIRCPECGRVRDFDATAEELELTPDQLRRAKEKRDARETADALDQAD